MERASPGDQTDTGLVCLVMVARALGLAADPEQIRHVFGGASPLAERDLVRAARWLGLKARVTAGRHALSGMDPRIPPALVQDREGEWFILASLTPKGAVVHHPRCAAPAFISHAELDARGSGKVLLLTRRVSRRQEHAVFGLAWFFPAILKYRALLGEVLIASLFLQVFSLLTPLFFQVVIDKVLVHRAHTTLQVLCIGLAVTSLFEVLLGCLRSYVFAHTTSRIDVQLGAELFRHLLRLPIAYFGARRVGDTVARVRELETLRNFITGSTLTLIIDVLFTVVFFAVMFLYSALLAWLVMATIPFYVLLAAIITPLFRSRLAEQFDRGAETQAFLVESVIGIEALKAAAVEPQQQARWEEGLAAYVRASFRAANLGNIAGQAAACINKCSTVLVLWMGAGLVIEGQLSVGELVAFNMLAGRLSAPILRLAQLWHDVQQAGISIRRLGDILNALPEPSHRPGRTALPALEGQVYFEQVGFRYRPDAPDVLRDLSFSVAAGEVIGIAGRSGSGKSTIARLLQRLHVPERGRITIDGVDLAMIDPAWLRRHLGVVMQDSVLFNRSVRENIALREPGLSMDRVVHAARLAGAHEFILDLPDGYDTIVGEQGSTLSGGQRQRIALARALVTDPRILILDEATSALDYESEAAIQRNMREICRGRTVFIIAHRLSALRAADRILVIDHGAVVEQGTHGELMGGKGFYARLHAIQGGLS